MKQEPVHTKGNWPTAVITSETLITPILDVITPKQFTPIHNTPNLPKMNTPNLPLTYTPIYDVYTPYFST